MHVSSDHWLIDSRANEHICSSLHLFHSYYKIKPINVNLPNGSSVLVQYAGTVVFSPHFHITHVLYSPSFKVNLISVSKICQSLPYHVHFLLNTYVIQDVKTQKMICLGNHCDGLYRLHLTAPTSPQAHYMSSVVSPSNKVSLQSCNSVSTNNHVSSIPSNAIWHFRLGHLSNQRLSMMHSVYSSITIDNKAICDICHFAKQRKLPCNLSTSTASSKFELLHFDIWGPLSITVVHSHKYFLTIVDDFSRFLWFILLKNKSEVSSHVKNFVTLIHTHYQITLKYIRSDNGPEFLLPEFYASKGIIHQKSCVETPQQNGRVERKHQHILNVARALLFQYKLPNFF